ncbi:hypothetical protein ES703_125502 [subsurface metagenome]
MSLIWIILGLLATNKKKDKSETLPEKGTGLKNGRAGERRAGKPRTEKERRERHYA